MKIAAFVVIALGVGIFLGRLSTSPNAPEVSPQIWAEKGLKRISTSGDHTEQLQAAEAYYGKAVVLFLASLVNHQRPVTAPVIVENAPLAEPIVKEIESTPVAKTHMPNALDSDVQETEDLKKVLAKDEALNNIVSYRKSPLATSVTPQVRKLNGSFSGTLKHEKPEKRGRVDQMNMEIQLEMREKSLQGSVNIQLINNGDVYSDLNGTGTNSALRLVPNQPDQVYIEPAPGRFILMDIRQPNRLTGRYFDADGSYAGQVQLWRK